MQVILMAGLQGVGKTTACGKLALYLQKQGKKVPSRLLCHLSCTNNCACETTVAHIDAGLHRACH